MAEMSKEEFLFGKQKVIKTLLKIAPPLMLSQLILALYNIVDSLFMGHYSDNALNALTIIYPYQYIAIALSVGLGVGVNTFMARLYALNEREKAEHTVFVGFILSIITWILFSIITLFVLSFYVKSMAKTPETYSAAMEYGYITCIGSLFIFLEAIFSRSHQARGNMIQPMISQIAGAVVNIILDPIMIFGWLFIPEMGASGAALATVIGQFVAFLISLYKGFRKSPKLKDYPYYIKKIFFYGYSATLQQLLFSVYIIALDLILAKFGENAITVLGLYYKLQTFFFIPVFALMNCIIPFLSYNAARKEYKRLKEIMNYTWIICGIFMIIGTICFIFIPVPLMKIFTNNEEVINIGKIAFPIIGSSFISAVFSLTSPTYFQAIGKGVKSTILVLLRQIILLVPLMYIFSFIGVNYTWIAFPISETVTGTVGIILYLIDIKHNKETVNKDQLIIECK